MPFSITTKDGITINGIPDDISPDDERLKTLVQTTREQRQAFPEIDISKDIGIAETLAISAGRGLTKIGRAVGLADPEQPFIAEQFKKLEKRRPISTTIGEIAGEAAPFLLPGTGVSAIVSPVLRFVSTALLGALEGLAITKGGGQDVTKQIQGAGVGGLAAGAAELVLPRISRIGRKVINRVLKKSPSGPIIDAAGNPSDEFIEALKTEGRSFDDIVTEVNEELVDELADPDVFARKVFLEAQGITPTKAQITRGAADFQAQQEAAKTSGAVREALEVQEAALTTRFDNAILSTQGEAVTATSGITDALINKATILDKEISRLYTVARETAPGKKNIKFSSLTRKLKDLAPSNRRSGGNIEAIIGDMQAKGILDQNLKVVGKVDVETAEDLRKLTNELFDPQNEFGNMLLREIKESLDDDVFRTAGKDVFKAARKAKRDFETGLTRAKISKFDSRKANLVRDILENKIDPDRFSDQVVFSKKWRATDLQQLKDYISTDEVGEKAFNDLRADVLNAIKEKSFIGPEDAAGNKALSRDKLQKALSAIGSKKLEVLFSPDERRFFADMLQVAKLREPVRGTVLGRGPSAQAVSKIEEKLKQIPIFGNLVDFIDVDIAGRSVLKAQTKRKAIELTGSQASQAIGQIAVAASIPSEDN